MFTGLIKEIGKIERFEKNTEGRLIQISCPKLFGSLKVDDSLAVNGVCQTVIELKATNSVIVQAVAATLEKTTFSTFKTGLLVNLESALTLQDALGGHLVSGHVSDVAKVTDIKNYGKNFVVTLAIGKDKLRYCIQEGSICLNGVSLTIYALDDERGLVSVSVIPHTWSVTTLNQLKIGSVVNVEFDMFAKYVERMMKFSRR